MGVRKDLVIRVTKFCYGATEYFVMGVTKFCYGGHEVLL
jgi:hypothetical protein